jgi:glutamate mutase epsilon subunit
MSTEMNFFNGQWCGNLTGDGARISAIQHLSIKYLEPYLKQVIQFTTVLQIRQANYPACIQWDQARL